MRSKGYCNHKEKKNTHLEDYEHIIGPSEQARDFEVITNCVMDHTQENLDSGRDFSEALTNNNKNIESCTKLMPSR